MRAAAADPARPAVRSIARCLRPLSCGNRRAAKDFSRQSRHASGFHRARDFRQELFRGRRDRGGGREMPRLMRHRTHKRSQASTLSFPPSGNRARHSLVCAHRTRCMKANPRRRRLPSRRRARGTSISPDGRVRRGREGPPCARQACNHSLTRVATLWRHFARRTISLVFENGRPDEPNPEFCAGAIRRGALPGAAKPRPGSRPKASRSSRATARPTSPASTSSTPSRASRRSCAAPTRPCTSPSRGPFASMPASPPPRTPTPSTAATWPPGRWASRSPSTSPPTAATTPTTSGCPATSAWPASRSTRSSTCGRCSPAFRSTR